MARNTSQSLKFESKWQKNASRIKELGVESTLKKFESKKYESRVEIGVENNMRLDLKFESKKTWVEISEKDERGTGNL